MTVSAHLLRHYGLRATGRAGIYTIRKSVTDPTTGREKQITRSTRTPDASRALEIARTIIDPFLASHGQSKPASTTFIAGSPNPFDQLCALYLSTASCAPATRKKNLACLRQLLAQILPAGQPPALTAIDGRLARQWLLARRQAAEHTHLPHDQQACESAKRGANSLYRQARSLFSRRQLATYADHGLTVPATLSEFASQSLLEAAPPPPCESLTPAQLTRVTTALEEARTHAPATYVATLLMLLGGLRNSEAAAARWDMLTHAPDGNWLLHLYSRAEYKPKAESRTITLASHVVNAIADLHPEGVDDTSAHLIPAATKTARHDACYRGVGALLRQCGITPIKGKLAYRLRAHAITQILLNHGMEAAQQFAGHTNPATTAIYKGSSIPYRPLSL